MESTRLLSLKTPLGDGALIPTRLKASDRLGAPYKVKVEAFGKDFNIQADKLLTKEVTVAVRCTFEGRELKRYFHGLVAEFARIGPGPNGYMGYRLVLVPSIWRLGLKTNCRIFQSKTAKDIVSAILSDHGLPDPSWGILPEMQSIEYCTQYNETDLHFVSRLLEEYGMSFYFSHTESAHTLHISATAPGFPAFEGGDVRALHSSQNAPDLSGWRRRNSARSAVVKFEDMDNERSQPSTVQSKTSNTRAYTDEPSMWSQGEVFRWPGGMSTRPGLDTAKGEMSALESESEEFWAHTLDPRFRSGSRMFVAVVEDNGSEKKDQYFVTGAWHTAEDRSALVSGAGAVEDFKTELTLAAVSRTWMPTQEHERPVLAGLYSAKVTGPSGEKIHVDEFGRIKIKFRWDRLGKDNETSSCWVRVSQAAAGSWGGTWFLPRVGDEVMVAFLDGDPDRPVVVASVYGKDAKPPFAPGSNRAQSGIKTRSYKSDSPEDSHVFRFEDKKGEEEILLHSERDLTIEVEHDEKRTIKNDRTTTVEQGNEKHTLKMGDLTIKCELGKIHIEAMQSITLKVGMSSVVLDQMGVTVKGMLINEEAQLMHTTKGTFVQETGTAMMTLQGGIIMVN